MRRHGRESMDLRTRVSSVRCTCSGTVLTVRLSLCVDALLANDLQLLCGYTMNQPIFFVDGLRSDWLECGRGHREGRGKEARSVTKGSFIDDGGTSEACPRGASFAGWEDRRSPDHF